MTTVHGPSAACAQRAAMLALELGLTMVARDALCASPSIAPSIWYVVGHARDELVVSEPMGAPAQEARRKDAPAGQGARCFTEPGMLASKLARGPSHPFLRAIRGSDDRVALILDGTLGLAHDALHAAAALSANVVGVEASPVLARLATDGLARLAATPGVAQGAAASILVVADRLERFVASLEPDSFDVVVLDPMMAVAKKSAPGFAVLRHLAVPSRASPELIARCARVARRRVVLKLGAGACPPKTTFHRVERGAHVAYWVHERCASRLG